MSQSVASQIRIDLIANAAEFNAGLRSGSQGLGSFSEEYEKTAGRVRQSQKALAADLGGRADAWNTAMKELRPEILAHSQDPRGNSRDALGSYAMENTAMKELRPEILARSQDPRGNSRDALGSYAMENTAMKELRPEIQARSQDPRGNNRNMLGWYAMENNENIPVDQAQRNQTRWKSMIPWGNSYRTELTREAALTASALGSSANMVGASYQAAEKNVSGERSLMGVGRVLLGRTALAPLGEMNFATEGMSAATSGVGMFAAAMMTASNMASAMGQDIKQLREEAINLGMTYDELSRKKGLPEYSRTTEGGALMSSEGRMDYKAGAAWLMGHVANIRSYGETLISDAAHTLSGGRYGTSYENAPDYDVAASYAEKARLDDADALKKRQNALNVAGAEKGIDSLQGKLSSLRGTADVDSKSNWIKNFSPTPAEIDRWDSLIDDIKIAKREMETTKPWEKAIHDPKYKEDEEYGEALKNKGKSKIEIDYTLDFLRKQDNEINALDRANKVADSLRGERFGVRFLGDDSAKSTLDREDLRWFNGNDKKSQGVLFPRQEGTLRDRANETPELKKLYQAYNDAELWHTYHKKRLEDEQTFADMKKKALVEYYRTAEGLDAKLIRKGLEKPHERYRHDQDVLQNAGGDVGLSREEIDKEAARRNEDERKRLGVGNPLGDFLKNLEEDRSALADKTISPRDYDALLKKHRKSAIGEMIADKETVDPVAAMEAGSREAHTIITRSMIADPKTKAAIDAARALDAIQKQLETAGKVSEEMLRALQEAII